MKTHSLKTLPVYFDAVHRKDKTFELRENDKDFQTGDILVLQEYSPPPPRAPRTPDQPQLTRQEQGFSGREITVVVTYTLHGGKYGLDPNFVIMGLGPHDGAVQS